MCKVWKEPGNAYFLIPCIFLYGSFFKDSNIKAINSQVGIGGSLWLEENRLSHSQTLGLTDAWGRRPVQPHLLGVWLREKLGEMKPEAIRKHLGPISAPVSIPDGLGNTLYSFCIFTQLTSTELLLSGRGYWAAGTIIMIQLRKNMWFPPCTLSLTRAWKRMSHFLCNHEGCSSMFRVELEAGR